LALPARRLAAGLALALALVPALALLRAPGAGAEARGAAPPDDAYSIAFASFSPLNNDVFIARGDGSQARPLLTGPWHDYNASLSPDGSWVTFTSERSGSADIYRVRPDGTSLERLVAGPAFDDQGVLSPDGRRLAFVSDRSGQAEIWVLDLQTGALRNVSNHPGGDFRPAWSPDGQWLAFTSDRESPQARFNFSTLHSTAIYLVRPDGTALRRLGSAGAFEGSPGWSPDGRSLVFYECDPANVTTIVSPRRLPGTTQLATLDIDSGKRRVLTDGPGVKLSPRWLSGTRLGYVRGGELAFLPSGTAGGGGINQGGETGKGGEIKGGEIKGGETKGGEIKGGEVNSPSWSADGATMVFHRETESAWPPFQRWHSLDPAFALVRTGVFPSYLPGGDRIVLNDRTAGILHNSIIVVGAGGGQPAMLFHDDSRSALAPAVSPSGRQIAFGIGRFFQSVQGKAIADIALVDADGGHLQLLTDGTGNFGLPSWSPDGRQLVYRAAGGGQDGLYIMDIASRGTRHVPGTGAKDNFPAWSPRGDLISFTSNRDGDYEIYTVHPDGSDLKRLTHRPGNDAHNSWSPDGAWIAFTSASGGFKDEAVLHAFNPQPYGDLYVMRADGSDVRRLTDNQFEEGTPAWSPVVRGGTVRQRPAAR
jgi:Tol biopolymer transport system component